MTVWHSPAVEHLELYSPIGLRLIDDVTGGAPIGRIRTYLDADNGAGGWMPTSIPAVMTPSGAITYPGLGRAFNPSTAVSRKYRIRLETEFYTPAYRQTADGIEFMVDPYDDTHAPAAFPKHWDDLLLLPAPNYPFPANVPVLRGDVRDPGGVLVADALVSDGVRERTLTVASGEYSLPLRWTTPGLPTPIDASDRAGRTGTIAVAVPADLRQSHTIAIA